MELDPFSQVVDDLSSMRFCKSYLYPHGSLTSTREHRGTRLHGINCIFTESCPDGQGGDRTHCSHTRGFALDWDSVCEQAKGFSLVPRSQKELKARESGRTKQPVLGDSVVDRKL